jgi:anaerobic magnesium-protoporphyrin IX monomethyl ester cyclase
MNVVFVRTPRYIWPFNSETSAFWQPLGLMSLAGQVEAAFPDWGVQVIDCPGRQIGWKTLGSILDADWPDVVCVGEEAVSSHEAMRLAAWVKGRRPQAAVVAGGVFFGHAKGPLEAGTIDYVVHGEGELTLTELLRCLAGAGDVGKVAGISYVRDGQVVKTPPRPLIADLDSLPMPAWSKVPMHQYGLGSRNHPGLVSIEHSRGCIDQCSFCILWKHMGRVSQDGRFVVPTYRTKSADRSIDEVKRLIRDHDRHTFGWVDPTWNADPQWTDRFCDLLLRQDIRIRQTAWVRADCIIRDHASGVLDKAVRAGLCQVMIGIERPDDASQKVLNKHANGPDVTAKALEILRGYPSVFTIGSVIFGLWDESPSSLDRLSRYCDRIGMDFCFFIPLTPNPGTEVHDEAVARGLIEVEDLRAYNFHTPVMRTRQFSAKQLERFYGRCVFGLNRDRFLSHLRRMARVRDPRRRRAYQSLRRYGLKIGTRYLWNRIRHPFSSQPTIFSRKPAWYDA